MHGEGVSAEDDGQCHAVSTKLKLMNQIKVMRILRNRSPADMVKQKSEHVGLSSAVIAALLYVRRTYFHHQHPRHDRPLGEMPREELVVDGHILDRYSGYTLLVLDDTIHKQKGKSVGRSVRNGDGFAH